jgi:hypothetical protein
LRSKALLFDRLSSPIVASFVRDIIAKPTSKMPVI